MSYSELEPRLSFAPDISRGNRESLGNLVISFLEKKYKTVQRREALGQKGSMRWTIGYRILSLFGCEMLLTEPRRVLEPIFGSSPK